MTKKKITNKEAIERLKENICAITLYVTEAKLDEEEVENELLNIETLKMAIEALQFQDIMINNPKTAKPMPEVCKNCKDNNRPHKPASDDLIIKGAKGIQDGLYNIQNGELFQYKAKGGTVRTYPIVEALQDDWITVSKKNPLQTGEYLVTAVCDNGATFTDKFGYTPTTDGGWYDPETPNQTYVDWNKHVIAWQPLPEPYNGDTRGEE